MTAQDRADFAKRIARLRAATDDTSRLAVLGPDPATRAHALALLVETVDGPAGRGLPVRRLLWILRRLAQHLEQPALVAAVDYSLARHFALAGRLAAGQKLLERARLRWLACGEHLSALRTSLGQMHLLNEMGEHERAIACGEQLLADLAGRDEPAARGLTGLAWLNLAACQASAGRDQHALTAWQKAEQRLEHTEHRLGLAQARNNHGIALMRLGRLDAALDYFAAARDDADALLGAQLDANEGEARLMAGEYSRALALFDRAADAFRRQQAPAQQVMVQCRKVESCLSLNLFPEALDAGQEVLPFLRRSGMLDEQARVLLGCARALAGHGRLPAAEHNVELAEVLAERLGNRPLMLLARLRRAELKSLRGQREQARQDLAALPVRGLGAPLKAMLALARADVAPDRAQRLKHLNTAAAVLAGVTLPDLELALLIRRGDTLKDSGQLIAAAAVLEEAVGVAEALRRNLDTEPLLRAFFVDKADAYHHLLEVELARGRPDHALHIAELAKARALRDALPHPDGTGDDAFLWRAINRDRARLLAIGTPPAAKPAVVADPHGRLRSKVRRNVRTAFRATDPALMLNEIRWPAHPVALFSRAGDQPVWFLRHADGRIEHGRTGAADSVNRELDALLRHTERMALTPALRTQHAGRMLDYMRRRLNTLYHLLFTDIDHALGRPEHARLTVIPHGPLAMLPLAALHDGDSWLVKRYIMDQCPALHLLPGTAKPLPLANATALVAAAADALIPEADREVDEISAALAAAGATVRTLHQARSTDLPDAAHPEAYLHLACHADFRHDNPMYSGIRLADRRVTAAELMNRPTRGRLAVLSACESGRVHMLAGDEPLGLPRALLAAGFESVVMNLWLTHDASARRLGVRFYHHMTLNMDTTRALAAAQLDLMATHPDPFYWAGQLVYNAKHGGLSG